MSSSKLIAKEDLSAFDRWELPNVDQRQPETESRYGSASVEGEEALHAPLTAEQLEAIQQEAYDEAYQRGYGEGLEQGNKAGYQSGQETAHAEVERLQQIAGALAEPLNDVNERVEQELLLLALTVARQLLRRELEADPEQVVAIVREALTVLPSAASRVRVYLHPDDARIVQADRSVGVDGDAQPWRIVADPDVTRGGCRVESEHSRIDATLEKRLSEVVAELMGGGRGPGQADV